MRLYGYWRSSAAYRVRIALNLKGLTYDSVPIHLVRGGGGQNEADYRKINPLGLVPTLVDDRIALGQSLAIIEYLEEVAPEPPLLPTDPIERGWVRQVAQTVACEIHPLNNLRVMNYLRDPLSLDAPHVHAWYRHWVEEGFTALNAMLHDRPGPGPFCLGATPGLADCCVVPQIYNARRYDVDMEPFPELVAVERACMEIPAFAAAAPENQPDAE